MLTKRKEQECSHLCPVCNSGKNGNNLNVHHQENDSVMVYSCHKITGNSKTFLDKSLYIDIERSPRHTIN